MLQEDYKRIENGLAEYEWKKRQSAVRLTRIQGGKGTQQAPAEAGEGDSNDRTSYRGLKNRSRIGDGAEDDNANGDARGRMRIEEMLDRQRPKDGGGNRSVGRAGWKRSPCIQGQRCHLRRAARGPPHGASKHVPALHRVPPRTSGSVAQVLRLERCSSHTIS